MNNTNETVLEKFLRYVSVNTQSCEECGACPSSEGQAELAALLVSELRGLGITDAEYDPAGGTVYAHVPATAGYEDRPVLGLLAHMDTSPEASGEGVHPRLVADYDGGDVILNEGEGIVLKRSLFPELGKYEGKTLIVTDGKTLLGADDKAGIAEIMTAVQGLMSEGAPAHGRIAVAFTPDEEIGRGTEKFDLGRFGADYAYTVDGGGLGELEYECFNAASARVSFKGVSIHTGDAKGKMINAARVAEAFDLMLPEGERPENTEGYEGFFHLESFVGGVEKAELEYLIRDHDREKFEARKELMRGAVDRLNAEYGEGTALIEIKDTYYNMREKICPDYMFLIERAEAAMRDLGIEPIVKPIRGGTDGASLSYRGLPCPNLCAGGHNFHGVYEYCCAESMESIVEILRKLIIDS